jgi:membrane protease subunit (stomatin/prohibitin family)
MGLFDKFGRGGGILDVIRCDEPEYLIWKWRPQDAKPGGRENAIRFGSSLRVKDGEVAVFVYTGRDGSPQDFIVGPQDTFLSTKNLPVLAELIGLAYDGDTPFQAEVYFINLAQINQVQFGVPFFDVYDARYMDFGVPVAVRGTVSFKIEDYQNFIKLHRLYSFDLDEFRQQVYDAICRYIKDTVANAAATHNIPVIQIESRIGQINDAIEYDVSTRLKEDFGVVTSGVDIKAIEIDKTSEGYRQLMIVTRDIQVAKSQADIEDYTEKLRISREEGQYAQHKATQSANIGAFQVEKQAEVGVAGAQALGQMGSAGNIDLGGGSEGGFNMAAMMTGMAVGSAVGQNIVGAMNAVAGNSVGGAMVGNAYQAQVTPPPIPSVSFHVAVNGQATGPYDKNTLRQMVLAGTFAGDMLVWRAGLQNWQRASEVDELADVLATMPPIPKV